MVLTGHDGCETALLDRVEDTYVIGCHEHVVKDLLSLLTYTYHHRLATQHGQGLGRETCGCVSGRNDCCKFHQNVSIDMLSSISPWGFMPSAHGSKSSGMSKRALGE